jgi:hypothetical protein
LEISEVSITEVELENGVVHGTAPPHEYVAVMLNPCCGGTSTYASADGSWTAVFNEPISSDRVINAVIYDPDGDQTMIAYPRPIIRAYPEFDTFEVSHFTPNGNLTITVKETIDGPILFGPATFTANEEGWKFFSRWFHLNNTSIKGNTYIEVTDEATGDTDDLVVADLTITEIDYANGKVYGHADPDTEFRVWLAGEIQDPVFIEGRSWNTVFSRPIEGYEHPQAIATEDGIDGDFDETVLYYAPSIYYYQLWDSIEFIGFSPDNEVTLNIYEFDGGPELIAPYTRPTDFSGYGMISSMEIDDFDIQPGMYITLEDEASSRITELVVPNIQITTFEPEDGVISGFAPPNAHVDVWLNNCGVFTSDDANEAGFWEVRLQSFNPNCELQVIVYDDNGDAAEATWQVVQPIGTEGGTVISSSGTTLVEIPAGALNESTPISITGLGEGFTLRTDLGRGFAVYGVVIGPDGTLFASDSTITMAWVDDNDDGYVDSTLQNECDLFISKDGVVITDSCDVDPGCDPIANTFTFQVSSLSNFSLASLTTPAITELIGPSEPVQLGESIEVSAIFSGYYHPDAYTATWDWGDGTISNVPVIGEVLSGTHPYQEAGVYTVKLTLENSVGEFDAAAFKFIVVYDPEDGFVTGGGWIDSPEGAYFPDPGLTGKASFGFISRYRKGADVPTGNTEFLLQVADLNFHSDVYQWLVVAGPKAQFKGTGTINGEGEYGFMLTAIDGDINGGGGEDKFRIKIWDIATDELIYDNKLDAPDDADPGTVLGGGSIKIHKGR